MREVLMAAELFPLALFGGLLWLCWWLSDGFRDIEFSVGPSRHGFDEEGTYRPVASYEDDYGPGGLP